MMRLQTELSQQRLEASLLMQEDENKPFLSFIFLVLFLFCRDTLAYGLEASVISREATDRARNATVSIYTKDYSWEDYVFRGSGFFVAPRVIATNFHVIEDKDKSKIKSILAYKHSKKKRFHTVKYVRAVDRKHDLAILQVSASNVKPLHLGDSRAIESLERVFIVGNPLGYEGKFSQGVISGEEEIQGVNYIQTDAAISPGSSGGPVMNIQGEVIGVATRAHMFIGQNLNFAIPSNRLKALLKRHSIPLPPKPIRKVDNNGTKPKSEAKAQAEVEKAKAEAERAKAEAEKAKAEAKKVEAEARIAEAESAKKEKDKPVTPKAQINKRLEAATVRIIGEDPNGEKSHLGSGFFIEPDRVATDFHVIQGSELKEIQYLGKRATTSDVLLDDQSPKKDKQHHLAILKVEKAKVEPLNLGNSDDVKIGQQIYMIGDPASGQVSEGKISDILEKDGVRYFQIDAEISPGSSGGPIVNSSGKVIAVSALKVPIFSGTLKYAIPAIYLKGLLATPDEENVRPIPDDSPDLEPPIVSVIQQGIEFYKKAQFRQAVEYLQSILNSLVEPKQRAFAHLYLGFSKWGLNDTKSSVSAEFRESLRYNPSVELPDDVGQNHPVFRPLLEQARVGSTGTLTITASPPETEIRIYGGEIAPELPNDRAVPIRLFRGNYAIEGILGHAHKVVPVLIKPGHHHEESLEMPATIAESQEFELTLDIFSSEQPKEVKVYYTSYDADGNRLGPEEKKEMQLREHKPETSTWVYHVKLPVGTQGGKIVYRIEADGKIIPSPPPQVEILEPPEIAFFDTKQPISIKARVISNVAVREVRVYYDLPEALTESSPSQALASQDSSNMYIGEIPVERKHTDGETWFYVTAAAEKGNRTRSATRAVRAKTLHPEIAVLEPPDGALFKVNQPINVVATVQSDAPVDEVRFYYDFDESKLSETSSSQFLEKKPSSETYVGEIPTRQNQNGGDIWYFVTATNVKGAKAESEIRSVRTERRSTPNDEESPLHQGVWASHSWSNLVSSDGFYSGWERGDVLSLAFMREGRGIQTLGARLDYTYENPDYISAMVQWGPSTRENPGAFAFLAGVTGYRTSDPSFSRVRRPRQLTPILGGSMKFFPLDRVTVDLTASMKLRSENREANGETDFADNFLHHYEMGIRLYISPSLNFKAGYGMWRLGGYDNTSAQVGLGATF